MMSIGQVGCSQSKIEGRVSAYNIPAGRHAQAEQQSHHQAAKVPAVVNHGARP